MPSFKTSGVISAVAGAASVMAHGHVQTVIADGVEYQGFALNFAHENNPPPLVGWSTTATDNGFVEPVAFNTGDIVCHRDATPGEGAAVVKAGGEIFLQWDTWPESHKGPVIDALAPVSGDFSAIEKESLEFFKIQEVGLVSGSGPEGTWASDQLIANGNGWLVQIPSTLASGSYVLRHEIIAHHASGQENGAQNYPQCVNIIVEDGGDDLPAGEPITSWYTATDPGILFDIYTGPSSYEIPGPAAPAIATVVEQRVVTAESTAEPVVGGGSGGGSGGNSPTPTDPEEDDEEESAAPSPSATAPAQGGDEDQSTAPETPANGGNDQEDDAEEVTECPTARRRRLRRAARAARRHARDVRV